MTINQKIRNEKLQYNIGREAAKILALSSGKTDKYEYFTGDEIQPSNKDQNCYLSFLTTTDSYHFLANTTCKEKRPQDFHKAASIIKKQLWHQQSWFNINLKLSYLLCPILHEIFMFCIYAGTKFLKKYTTI